MFFFAGNSLAIGRKKFSVDFEFKGGIHRGNGIINHRRVAFTRRERALLGLTGRLPSAVEISDQQAARAWHQLNTYEKNLGKCIFLDRLHNKNEVLYFKILSEHLE